MLGFGSPDRYLGGTYMYSYSGFLRADPAYKAVKLVPQLAAYVQQDLDAGAGFKQVPGFVPIGYVGWMKFGNSQSLSGKGSSQVGGSKPGLDIELAGIVTKAQFEGGWWMNSFISGEFITYDVTDLTISFTHAFVMSGDCRQIVFTVTDGGARDMVASGVMTRVTTF